MIVLALLATLYSHLLSPVPVEVLRDTLAHCTPVILPAYLGCEDRTYLPSDDATYIGLIILPDGTITPDSGP